MSGETYTFVDQPPAPTTYTFVEPKKIGMAGFPDAVKDTVADFHPLTQMAVGGKALLDMSAYKLKQSFGAKLTPEEEQAGIANRALWEESNPAKAGAVMTGLGLYPLAAPVGNFVAARIAPALPGILAPSLTAATNGMVANVATTPRLQGDAADSTEAAAQQGGIGGILGDAIFRGGARLVQPILQSPQVKALLAKDIVPTMGSAAGGIWRDIEDKAVSLPLVGNLIQNARRRSVEDFNRAALGMAMPPGVKAQEVGDAGVAAAKNELGGAYDKVYGNASVAIDHRFLQDVFAAKSSTTIPLSRDGAKQFDKIIQRDVLDRMPGQTSIPAAQAKQEIEADLGKASRELKASTLASERAVGEALGNARDAFRELMARNVGPEASKLPPLNQAYSNLIPLRAAADRAKAAGGVFTPYQLQAQARQGTDLRDLANAAQGVLPNTIANSGTTDRALATLLMGGGAAGAATPFFGAPYLAGLAAAPLAYSRTGARYMLGDLPGQGILSEQLRALAPYGAAGGGILRGQQDGR